MKERRDEGILMKQAVEAYWKRFDSFLLLRMFVGGYQQAPDDVFLQAVDGLLVSFKKEALASVADAIKGQNTQGVDIERARVLHYDALKTCIDQCRTYMVALRNETKAPGEAKL